MSRETEASATTLTVVLHSDYTAATLFSLLRAAGDHNHISGPLAQTKAGKQPKFVIALKDEGESLSLAARLTHIKGVHSVHVPGNADLSFFNELMKRKRLRDAQRTNPRSGLAARARLGL